MTTTWAGNLRGVHVGDFASACIASVVSAGEAADRRPKRRVGKTLAEIGALAVGGATIVRCDHPLATIRRIQQVSNRQFKFEAAGVRRWIVERVR